MHLHNTDILRFQCCDNTWPVTSCRRFETSCKCQVRIRTGTHSLLCHVPRRAYRHPNLICLPKASFQWSFHRNFRKQQRVEACGQGFVALYCDCVCRLSYTGKTAYRLHSRIHGVSVPADRHCWLCFSSSKLQIYRSSHSASMSHNWQPKHLRTKTQLVPPAMYFNMNYFLHLAFT